MKQFRHALATLAAVVGLQSAATAAPYPVEEATIAGVQAAYLRGEVTTRQIVAAYLERIAAYDQRGPHINSIINLNPQALAEADALDAKLKATGKLTGPLHGVPVLVKDCIDALGMPTTAGFQGWKNYYAPTDAPLVAQIKAAGGIILGKASLSEFTNGGGDNINSVLPGFCRNPYNTAYATGGSSGGTGASIASNFALVGIGTDTGGSVRIPASLCGLTGFKPTARRVSREGAYPLSGTLDSIGPLAASVQCCAIVDAIMAGEAARPLSALHARGMRLGVVRDLLGDNLDEATTTAFERALAALSAAGAQVDEVSFEELRRLPQINRHGGFSGAEALALHRARLATDAERYDARVARRILAAGAMNAADYVDMMAERVAMIARFEAVASGFDALVSPTVARVAPPIAEIEHDDQSFLVANGLILRNTAAFNFLDACALSLPCHRAGEAPVGLMVAAPALSDARLLRVGAGIEAVLAGVRAA
jgi:aspartyl-tRNA(Asn)/glutamyl-tRNA(Gln) amidotransferase subunit A